MVNFSKMANSNSKFFHKLNHKKAKKYTYDHFKNRGMSKAGIYKILARFEEHRNVDCKGKKGKIMKAD